MIIRVNRHDRNFTILGNDLLRDKALSYRARGILGFLLSHPPDAQLDSIEIAQAGTEGRDAVRTALKELRRAGYLVYRKVRDEAGRTTTEIVVSEIPTPENPSLVPSGETRETPGRTKDGKPGVGKPGDIQRTPDKDSQEWARDLRYQIGAGWEPVPGVPHKWRVPGGPERPAGTVDALWEALVAVCQLDTSSITVSARSVLNRSVEELRRAGADPVEIQQRAARYRAGTAGIPKGAKLTHRALVVHWPALAAQPPVPVVDPDAAPTCPPHRDVDTGDDRGGYCLLCKTFESQRGEP